MKKKVLFLIPFIVLGLVLLFKVSMVKADENYYEKIESANDVEVVYYWFLTATKVKNLKNIINNSNTEDGYVKYNSEHQTWDYFLAETYEYVDTSYMTNRCYHFCFENKDVFGECTSFENIPLHSSEVVPLSTSGSEITYEEVYETYFNGKMKKGYSNGIGYVLWIDETGKISEISDFSEIAPDSLQTFINNIPSNYGNPDLKFQDPYSYSHLYFSSNSYPVLFSISHTWKASEILDKYDDEDIIYSPAVYFALYKLEIGVESVYNKTEDGNIGELLYKDPLIIYNSVNVPTYTNYCLEGTGECTTLSNGKLANSSPKYSDCPTTLSEVKSNILVSNPENYSYTTKTDKTNNRYCYYSKNTTQDNKPKYTLTVKYSETSDCSNTIRDNTVKENLTAGSTIDIEIPSTITINDAKVKYSAVGNINPTGFKGYTINNKTLSVVIPSATDENDRNVEICLVYTPNLGVNTNLIYLVFMISFGTLSCSIYYFYKYFKNKKTA